MEPAETAGQGGKTQAIKPIKSTAARPMTAKASCQPNKWPSFVPIGNPITVATTVPHITTASPKA